MTLFLSVAVTLIFLSLATGQGGSKHAGPQQASGPHEITLCPDDYKYLPRNECVTLDQLLSDRLVKSNMTFKFVTVFDMKPNMAILFEDVTNITLDTVGPQRANITCVSENSGFIFFRVSELAIQNIAFIGCGVQNSITIDAVAVISLLDSSNIILTNVDFRYGKGSGIFGANVYGYLKILKTEFKYNMNGPGIGLYNNNSNLSNYLQANITISNSVFDSGYCGSGHKAFVMDIQFRGQLLPARVYIDNVVVTNNTYHGFVSGISIVSEHSPLTQITVEGYNYSNNRFVGDMYSSFSPDHADFFYQISHGVYLAKEPFVKIIDSIFANNQFGQDIKSNDRLTVDTGNNRNGVVVFISDTPQNGFFLIQNTNISNNSGRYYTAIYSYFNCDNSDTPNLMNFEMRYLNVVNNTFSPSVYYNERAVGFRCVGNITVHSCSFVNNSATGLQLHDSHIRFSGYNILRGNKGYNGGGMAMYGNSYFSLAKNVRIILRDNSAENVGGGVYVKQISNGLCFYQPDSTFFPSRASLEFYNNSAKTAGNDFYGGNMYTCQFVEGIGRHVLTDIFHSPDNYTIDVTSDPLHVCDCYEENNEECINIVHTIHTVWTYPGKRFSLSLVAVGQLLNTGTLLGVPSAVYAGLLPLHNNTGSIPNSMLVQSVQRNCTKLEYLVSSNNSNETMLLALDNSLHKIPEYFMTLWNLSDSQWISQYENLFIYDLTVPAYVVIKLRSCPVGFELLEGKCECSKSLKGLVVSCSIETELITRKPSVWLSAIKEYSDNNYDRNFSTVYLTHKHCPFDYCNSSNFGFLLDQPDAQCNHDRSSVLCGKCKPGYSLMLGRTECRQCTNIYLLLLIPFGFAGILLIVFLSFTNLTVAAGTINGLLFFANVVRENQATFFAPQAAKGFLSVFIAWLNLDFGIGTCFYDGLDSYAFTWLQLSFPIFIWFLAFSIILISRHVALMNKVCGPNIVQILATLFLLSYTKLQRTIVTSLSFTAIDVSNGTKYYIWLKDGNVHYLQGKHIFLFLVNFLFLLILFIPYTLSIMLGPWLQSKTQYRVFCWVVKLKPFFDAYFGPLKDNHRYWTGILLLSRMILSLVSAVNVLGDDSINLLAIITLSFVLLALLWQSGGVYKVWTLSFLDSFFLINLGLLASATLYNKASGGNQYATVSISTASAFAVFCLILLYHCIFTNTIILRQKSTYDQYRPLSPDDDDMLDTIDSGRGLREVPPNELASSPQLGQPSSNT